MLPLCFTRLEFKVCKGQPAFFELAVYTWTCGYTARQLASVAALVAWLERRTAIAGPQVRFLSEDLVLHFSQPFLVRSSIVHIYIYAHLDYPLKPAFTLFVLNFARINFAICSRQYFAILIGEIFVIYYRYLLYKA